MLTLRACAVLMLLLIGAGTWKVDAAQHYLRPGEQAHRPFGRGRWIGRNAAELARYTPTAARTFRHGILFLRLALASFVLLLWLFLRA